MTIRSFSQNMLRLGTLMGLSRAFSRFLDMAVVMNNHNRDESFRTLLVTFQKSERYLMMETYASLVLEMTGDGSGLTDVLGEFYAENVVSFRPMTPQKYYDMLPGLFRSDGSIFRVADYRCQTGRRLLAAAKFNRSLRFYGADPDITHVLMTLLNLCINGLYGEVAWYDARVDLFYAAWGVDLNDKGRPSIRKLEDQESLFFQKRGDPGINLHRLNFNF